MSEESVGTVRSVRPFHGSIPTLTLTLSLLSFAALRNEMIPGFQHFSPSRQRGDAGSDALSGRSAARILEVGTLGNHLVAKRKQPGHLSTIPALSPSYG